MNHRLQFYYGKGDSYLLLGGLQMKRDCLFPVAVGEELTPADTKPPGQLLGGILSMAVLQGINPGCSALVESETCTMSTQNTKASMMHWSCCRKKTSDLNSFLQRREKQPGDEEVLYRFDWHQTGSQVVNSLF
ncbi:cysteine and histidine-rich domain-containing protein 1a [Thunnus thynnus]|uniref:cysteine and histidine-rich domain-containing protein 1a n=1 Tax=Thunnus thynnus TaxID=8237 RepID=UPI003528E365